MGSTSVRASEAIWLLIGGMMTAAPTGVAAQVQAGSLAFQALTPAAQGPVATVLPAAMARQFFEPDLATGIGLMAHADPMRDATPRLAASGASEPALRQALQRALWPADIVLRSDDYLLRYPDHASAADVLTQRRRASATTELLRRSDVALFRAAFVPQSPDGPEADDLRRAALGDADAAVRLAERLPALDVGSQRRVGWLQYAALLGSDRAAYALSLHYRRAAQPLMAAQFEARALALGFQPPAGLDHTRK